MHKLIEKAVKNLKPQFESVEKTALNNQEKVLNAFRSNRVALRHFAPTTGYGYDDVGRDTLNKVFADVFCCDDAIVSPMMVSGTHALNVAMSGMLRPKDKILFATGEPYDTLYDCIYGVGNGSLFDYGITSKTVQLLNGAPDLISIDKACKDFKPNVVMIQRSRGYDMRPALSIATIQSICAVAKKYNAFTLVDNCYGEFTETTEPTPSADIAVGSLIKNVGGGIAPTGGYICGTKNAIKKIESRFTAPSIGREVGSYAGDYRLFYEGLFLAPHIVEQSIKTAMLFSYVFGELGYETLPKFGETYDDIICSIKFNDKDKLISFCKSVQAASPVDSFVTPEPWDMPGYNDKVIMADGSFVQGASIELSCDSPIRPPYVAYLQGGLTFEHGVIALNECLQALEICN